METLFGGLKQRLMLIIGRKKYEKLMIADEVEITILEIGRNRVRFGIKAPKHIRIQTRLKTDPLNIENELLDDLEEVTYRELKSTRSAT
jgi:carbon storage regulator